MGDLKQSFTAMDDDNIEKHLGFMLMEFYEDMKHLESDRYKGGKQATRIIMGVGDLKKIFDRYYDNTI